MPDFDLDLGLDGIVDYDFAVDFGGEMDFNKNVKTKSVPNDPYANNKGKV